jgi:hypothetical protein
MIREKRIAASLVPTPAAGTSTMFVDTDGLLKVKDENGTVRTAANTPSGADVVNTVKNITGTTQAYTVEAGIAFILANLTSGVLTVTLPNPATNVGRELKFATVGEINAAGVVNGGLIRWLDYLGNSLFAGQSAMRGGILISNGTVWAAVTYTGPDFA